MAMLINSGAASECEFRQLILNTLSMDSSFVLLDPYSRMFRPLASDVGAKHGELSDVISMT
jgi:hypothetical protein